MRKGRQAGTRGKPDSTKRKQNYTPRQTRKRSRQPSTSSEHAHGISEHNHDTVTFGLYSVQENGSNFNRSALGEIAKIKRIMAGLTAAAKKKKKTPLRFVISAYVIPDWGNKSSYEDSGYKAAKKDFFNELDAHLGANSGVELEDFYKQLLNEIRDEKVSQNQD